MWGQELYIKTQPNGTIVLPIVRRRQYSLITERHHPKSISRSSISLLNTWDDYLHQASVTTCTLCSPQSDMCSGERNDPTIVSKAGAMVYASPKLPSILVSIRGSHNKMMVELHTFVSNRSIWNV